MTEERLSLDNKKICEVCGKPANTKNSEGCEQWYGIKIGHRYCYYCYHSIIRPSTFPKVPCICGCGELIPAINRHGKPAKYKNHHHPTYRENHYRWKGGRIRHKHGYIWILKPDHHFADMLGHVLEHRIIWEEFYNVCLLHSAVIHHKNGIKDDNRIENLQLMTWSDHGKHEATLQWKTRKRPISY